jgi:hypothetical protein
LDEMEPTEILFLLLLAFTTGFGVTDVRLTLIHLRSQRT